LLADLGDRGRAILWIANQALDRLVGKLEVRDEAMQRPMEVRRIVVLVRIIRMAVALVLTALIGGLLGLCF
jgi:hypothetical protein